MGTNHLTSALVAYDAAGSLTDWNYNRYAYDKLSTMTAWCATTTGGPGTGCAPGAEQWGYVYTADDERLIALKHGESRSTWTVRDFGGQVLTRDERYPQPTESPEGGELWSCPGPSGWVFCDGFETGNTVNWTQTSTGRSRKITDYVRRGSQLVGADTLDDVRRHFALDHLGSPRLVTNDIGEVVAQHTYFPFGQEATPLGQDPEVMKFTGHERDSKSTPGNPADDLDYLHARYSSPIVGRFLAVDPAGGNPKVPQGWNRYAYVRGNPLKLVDPTGMATISVQGQNNLQSLTGWFAELFSSILGFGEEQSASPTAAGPDAEAMEQEGLSPEQLKASQSAELFKEGMETGTAFVAAGIATGLVVVGSIATTIDDLSAAASTLYSVRSGLTVAGRNLQKHATRRGSFFAGAKGSAAQLSARAQELVDDALTNPRSTFAQHEAGRFGMVLDVYHPAGYGVRYSSSGQFLHFLEPPRW